jgi:4-amino-4-deoxy-L-arabinose transferase-like glycosyltransferase
VRALAGRVPAAGWAVTAAALCLGVAWSLLTPPFQVPDETSHVAYVQHLAETGRLPKETADRAPFSPQENAILGAIGFSRIIGRQGEKTPASAAEERYLRTVERQGLPDAGAGNATTASNNPPLYYLLQTPVYLATSSGSLLTQLVFMRLLSVLFTSLTVLLAFLFARELLPRSPWAWTAGGLACAFQPVLGFVGSGVNPDSLLFLCATGTLLASARLVRRGLTTRRAVILGAFVLGGLLTKPLFLALVPAAGLALLIAAYRGRAASPWRPLLIGGAVILLPMAVYTLIASGPLDHPYFAVAGIVAGNASGSGSGAAYTSVTKELSFLLQQFLPKLPFLTDFVPGTPIEDTWINGLTGVFGWLDYQLPIADTHFAVRLLELLLILAAVALIGARRRLVEHLPLAAVCLVAMGGLLGAVGVTDYQAFLTNGARFQQARYVLPLVALYGGLFALAAKGLGARLSRVAVPALWVLVGLHTVAAMVLTANRYYL